jgi:hypothetical protein
LNYYIRILSATEEAPTPADMGAAVVRAGCAPAGIRGADPKDADWRQIDIEYCGDRCPLRIERTIASEPGNLPEVARFKAAIGKPGRSKAKKQVLEFLDSARQVITLGVPDHVIDGDDWAMVHALLYFLQPRVNGFIQADGEGIYNGDGKLLVTLE